MVWGYWKRVLYRAFRESLSKVGITSRGGVMVGAAFAGLYLLFVYYFLGADIAAEELRLRVVGVVTLTSSIPLWFAWNLLVVPAEMDAEAATKIHDLEDGLKVKINADADAKRRRKLMHVIMILHDRGIKLFSREPTLEQYDNWNSKYGNWDLLVNHILRNDVSAQAAMQFNIYSVHPSAQYRFPKHHGEEHLQLLQRLESQLQHLREYMQENKQYESLISPEEWGAIEEMLAQIETELLAADGAKALDEKDGSKSASGNLIP